MNATQKPLACSIHIFLVDGAPEGLRTVKKSNWSGRALVADRSQLTGALAREELNRPGVYVLTGPDDGGVPRLYVGEADHLGRRIRQQAADKDFWTGVIAFSSADGSLNKAHVRYLEFRLIKLAHAANQWELDNNTTPPEPPLSEADQADAEGFLAEMRIIYPILGIDAFEAAATEPADGRDAKTPLPARRETATAEPTERDDAERLFLAESGAKGEGRETAGGFIVLAGSRARVKEVRSIHGHMRDMRRELLKRNVLKEQDDYLEFTQNFRFTSPSMAAGVLVARPANGRTAWKNSADVTLKEIQNARTKDAG